MEHIETIELSSTQSSVTFSSIPQDYDDLVLLSSIRVDDAGFQTRDVGIKPNGLSINGSGVRLFADGSSIVSDTVSQIHVGQAPVNNSVATGTFNSGSTYISNYAKSQPKSFSTDVVEGSNDGRTWTQINAMLWDDTSAIASLEFYVILGEDLFPGTTISLYGITAGGDGTVTTS